MILDFLFLPLLFFIGLITSYQDFRYGKIKNKWIILGLVWSLGIYVLFLLWGLIAPYFPEIYSQFIPVIFPSYILKVLINSIIALIVGYLLWHFNLWSAGDAKLFFVFSLLLPLEYYWKGALPYFPSFVLLINIFIPVLLFLVGQNLFYILKTVSISKIVNFWHSSLSNLKINYPSYLKVFFGFFLIFLTFQIINLELKNFVGQFGWWQLGIIFLIVLLHKSLNKIFQKNWFLILFFLTIVGYFSYFPIPLAEFSFLIQSSLFFMAIFVIIALLASLIEEGRKKEMPFAIWVMIGALITIILNGPLISLLFKAGSG